MKPKNKRPTTCQKPLPVVAGMNRIHSLQLANPRGVADLKHCVRLKSAGRKRMAAECFIVRGAEHMGRWPVETHTSDGHPFGFWRHPGCVATIPLGVRFGDEISKQEVALVTKDQRQRCADVLPWGI